MTATSVATTVRWPLAIGLVVVTALMPGTAQAWWTGTASGTVRATVATPAAPEVVVQSPQFSDEVRVEWSAPTVPAGMTIRGYRVSRFVGGAAVDACGTSPTTLLSAATLACTDTGLPDGEFDYAVTADLGSWTSTGDSDAAVVVAADRTGPRVDLSGTDRDNAVLDRRNGETVLFFRSAAPTGGSIVLEATVTDDESGPASTAFPAISGDGWVHDREEVVSGTGSGDTLTYRSAAFSFSRGAATPEPFAVTGRDRRGNETDVRVTVVADDAAPVGGSLRVNGRDASAGGSSSTATGDFSVDAVTPFTEDADARESGLRALTLVRESATLADGTCGPFSGGADLDVVTPLPQSGLADGCYRYTLTGIDRVGNAASVSTTVQVDTSAPTGGALRANLTDAAPGGVTSVSSTGTWAVDRTNFTDSGSGLASSILTRSTGTLAGGSCSAFGGDAVIDGSPAVSAADTGCYRYQLVGTDRAGLAAALEVTVQVDRIAPTGGSVRVNGVNASGANPVSTRTSDSVVVEGLTDYSDAQIGMADTALTRAFAQMTGGVCGSFGSPEPVGGSGTFTVSGLADGCHLFTLTGRDLAGNESSISTTVRLDASAPTAGVLTVNTVAASPTGTMAYTAVAGVSVQWTKFSDPESGMSAALVQRTTSTGLANGACTLPWVTTSAATLTATLTPTTGTAAQTLPTALRCYRYVLSGTNGLGVPAQIEVVVMYDNSAPTSTGNLTVNGTNAATAGSSSSSTTGTFTISGLRTYTDGQSGMQGTTLTRTWSPVINNVCQALDPATRIDITGAAPIAQTTLPVGCYRYVQTGTNMVGTPSSVFTTVRVDSTAPTGGTVTANGTVSTTGAGSLSYSSTGAWTVDTVPFADTESTVTNTLARSATTSLSNGTCGTFSAATNSTITAVTSTAESGIATGCIRYVLTGRNSLNLTAPTVTTIVRVDTSAPGTGALTVNNTAATVAGSTSTSATGSFSISVRTNYTDTHSGIASGSLTRTYGPTCATLDSATTATISGNAPIAQSGLAPGCYRYVLSATNGAGLSSSIATSVTVGP